MDPLLFPTIAILVGLLAAITDLRSGRIPNHLTLTAMLVGVALHLVLGGALGAIESALGATICAAVPAIVYKASQGRGIGGGDIKLFAALGALLGPTQGLEAELSAFLLIGIYALFRLAFLGRLWRTLVGSLRVTAGFFISRLHDKLTEEREDEAMTTMRMGPAILLAVITVVALPYVNRWFPWLG